METRPKGPDYGKILVLSWPVAAGDPPPETAEALVTVAGALEATFTVTVIEG